MLALAQTPLWAVGRKQPNSWAFPWEEIKNNGTCLQHSFWLVWEMPEELVSVSLDGALMGRAVWFVYRIGGP